MDGQALGWPMSLSGLLSLPVLAGFAILPGAPLSFGLRCAGLSLWNRTLIAIALTPFTVAATLMLLKGVGLDFEVAARVVLVLCVGGLIAIALRSRSEARPGGDAFALAMTGAVLVSVAVIPWILWQGQGVSHYFFGHASHHADLVYAVTREGIVPENTLLAGTAVRYPFFAHYYWAWVGWCLDLNPLLLWERTALTWFAATGFLFYSLGRSIGLRPGFAVLGVALLMWGNSPLETLQEAALGPLGANQQRYAWFPQKFLAFNLMPFAIASLVAVLLVGSRLLHAGARASWFVLLSCSLTSAGVVYPILFPCALASSALLLWLGPPDMPGAESRARLRSLLIALSFAACVALATVLFFVAGRAETPLESWRLASAASKLRDLLVAFGPYLLVALPELVRGVRRRDRATVLLMGVAASGAGFYVLLPLPAMNEYKGIHVAMLGFALLAARSLDVRFGLRERSAFQTTAVLVALLVARLAVRHDLPSQLPLQPAARPLLSLDLGSFEVSLRHDMPGSAWLRVMSERTPPDTVLVAPVTSYPVSMLTRRAEYIGLWKARGRQGRPGYGYTPEKWIVQIRGGSERTFLGRRFLHRLIYGGPKTRARFDAVASSLGSLGRPVAIFFPSPGSPFLGYLEDRGLGRAISTEGGVVWQIDPEQFVPGDARR